MRLALCDLKMSFSRSSASLVSMTLADHLRWDCCLTIVFLLSDKKNHRGQDSVPVGGINADCVQETVVPEPLITSRRWEADIPVSHRGVPDPRSERSFSVAAQRLPASTQCKRIRKGDRLCGRLHRRRRRKHQLGIAALNGNVQWPLATVRERHYDSHFKYGAMAG